MITASQGLGKALARVGGGVVAFSEMPVADILANLSDEQRAELAASVAPPAPVAGAAGHAEPDGNEPDGDPDDSKCSTCKEPMKDGKCAKCAPDSNASEASATARIKAVAAAVATDDACKGKADLALGMLADDDYAALSASGIVKLLSKQPASASTRDGEEDDGRAMLAAMREGAQADLGQGGATPANAAAAENHGWGSAVAKANRLLGRK